MENGERAGHGKIMIVDDQAGIRLLLSELLKREGYVPVPVGNGNQALQIIQEDDPVLVLLDMKIPGMNGMDVLKEMKKRKPAIKVIMMTAYEDEEIIEGSLRGGALACFSKPFDLRQMIARINKEVSSSK